MDMIQLSLFDGKVCTYCHQWQPFTQFYKNGKLGLHSYCKSCFNTFRKAAYAADPEPTKKAARSYYEAHRVERRAYARSYTTTHKERIRQRGKAYHATNREHRNAQTREWRADNVDYCRMKDKERRERTKDQRSAQNRAWRIANRAWVLAYMKRWRKQHPRAYAEWRAKNLDHARELGRNFRVRHKDRLNARTKAYFAANPDKKRVYQANRRARKSGAGGSYSPQDWHDLKQHYDFRCLCCGRKEPEIKLTQDHVVPLSKGGDNRITNIQPLCLACNMQKQTKTTDYRTSVL